MGPVTVEPEHPYRSAQDASYAPPQSRNVGAPFKAPANKKPEAAYCNAPSIYSQEHAQAVYDRAIKTPITITHEELLSLALGVRARFREAVTTRRSPPKEGATADAHLYNNYDDNHTDNFFNPILDDNRYIETFFNPTAVPIVRCQHRAPPPGATIIPDPIEAYYRGLGPGEKPNPEYLTVAKESCALRSIFPLIDNNQKVESVLDPGCQIVAMSEAVSNRLGISYDPDVVLHMLSANGAVDSSLGLACNIPFNIGNLTFYMQAHVIRSPAYEILLGRPFDVLTESVVRNFANADQTITVHDPNTHRTATIPTAPRRGTRRHDDDDAAVFRE